MENLSWKQVEEYIRNYKKCFRSSNPEGKEVQILNYLLAEHLAERESARPVEVFRVSEDRVKKKLWEGLKFASDTDESFRTYLENLNINSLELRRLGKNPENIGFLREEGYLKFTILPVPPVEDLKPPEENKMGWMKLLDDIESLEAEKLAREQDDAKVDVIPKDTEKNLRLPFLTDNQGMENSVMKEQVVEDQAVNDQAVEDQEAKNQERIEEHVVSEDIEDLRAKFLVEDKEETEEFVASEEVEDLKVEAITYEQENVIEESNIPKEVKDLKIEATASGQENTDEKDVLKEMTGLEADATTEGREEIDESIPTEDLENLRAEVLAKDKMLSQLKAQIDQFGNKLKELKRKSEAIHAESEQKEPSSSGEEPESESFSSKEYFTPDAKDEEEDVLFSYEPEPLEKVTTQIENLKKSVRTKQNLLIGMVIILYFVAGALALKLMNRFSQTQESVSTSLEQPAALYAEKNEMRSVLDDPMSPKEEGSELKNSTTSKDDKTVSIPKDLTDPKKDEVRSTLKSLDPLEPEEGRKTFSNNKGTSVTSEQTRLVPTKDSETSVIQNHQTSPASLEENKDEAISPPPVVQKRASTPVDGKPREFVKTSRSEVDIKTVSPKVKSNKRVEPERMVRLETPARVLNKEASSTPSIEACRALWASGLKYRLSGDGRKTLTTLNKILTLPCAKQKDTDGKSWKTKVTSLSNVIRKERTGL